MVTSRNLRFFRESDEIHIFSFRDLLTKFWFFSILWRNLKIDLYISTMDILKLIPVFWKGEDGFSVEYIRKHINALQFDTYAAN